jgi:glycosyltransferase involved in cell wall biosynthesis
LHLNLQSILHQYNSFPEFEVVVVDDGSTDDTETIVRAHNNFPVRYLKLDNPVYRNPSFARNMAYKGSCGDILICQSDDVVHESPNTIWNLVNKLDAEKEFLLATVYNYDLAAHQSLEVYIAPTWQRPYFFLGSVARRHVYSMGGNCEEFNRPGYEDDWFAACLRGQNLVPKYDWDIIGLHQHHSRPDLSQDYPAMQALYQQKCREGKFVGGDPWWYEQGKALIDIPYV